MKQTTVQPVWQTSKAPVTYPEAIGIMKERVARIHGGSATESVWLLEHPHLFTAGTSASAEELLDAGDMPVFKTGRGGRYTYHGPGQRIAYVMLDLTCRGRDIHRFVEGLENWIIATLDCFGVKGERRSDRVGVWVVGPDGREEKIAAIGVRVRRWVTFHGISINRDPDLSRFAGIVPCGISEHGVTSLAALGIDVSASELDEALQGTFDQTMPARQNAGDDQLVER
ncbi:MAG: lipoyl(octanoyl) transferase LipB [Alphaproteobacteria bacterium]|jgi:lipoyl(octanoyl) transferase|nr:lipoyl(octanoyl) transferase LipB [Rhodospirillaceae bacterium]MBT6204627.1 lipoyl(octanoyl) transferase LipB [Rhodospirillaceae bacterium]MDG2480900.1 lipoyl(octanoyl) transferase LipB [Alphaproteobacteria bacterium]